MDIQLWAIFFAIVSIICNLFLSWIREQQIRKQPIDGDAVIFLVAIAVLSLIMAYGMIATMIVGN